MSVINALKSGGSVNLTETEALVEELEIAVGTYPYSVANTLTNCTSSNNATTVQASSSYSATITADEGYTLTGATVSVTMGGNDVTSTAYSNGVISIASVTGDIAISVSAVEDTSPVEYFVTFSSPSSFTIGTANSTKNWNGTIEYSTDKTNWNTWAGTSVLVGVSDGTSYNLYLRGTNNTYITGSGSSVQWSVNTNGTTGVAISGNIENLLDYATVQLGNHPTMSIYCFRRLFYTATGVGDCSKLILGALTVPNYGYATMFSRSSITAPPILMATSIGDHGCNSMFYNCTSLDKLTKLNIITIGTSGCLSMFYGCTNIKMSTTQTSTYVNAYTIPTASSSSSYTDMFLNTGGSFSGTPTFGTTYYTSNDIIDGTED